MKPKNNLKGLIIFDLDDTLVDTSDLYWRARSEFIKLFVNYKVDELEILETFEKIEANNIKIDGIIPERYKKSMYETMNFIKNNHQLNLSANLEKEIEVIGDIIISKIPDLIDGAIDLLQWSSQNFNLVLLTRGIENIQYNKIKKWSLNRFFKEIYVVETKNSDLFLSIIAKFDQNPTNCWIIGDSIKSDINNGLKINCNCILYKYSHPNYIWRQEYNETPIGKFYIANRLSEIKDIITNPKDHNLYSSF